MSNKTFTFVGSSILNGKFKVRYTNDNTRVKVLVKNGHKDVNFVELPRAMTKAEIEAEGFLAKVVPEGQVVDTDASQEAA